MPRITDDELRALTDAEIRDAESYCGGNGRIAAARQRNEYYFLGLAKGDLAPPEISGRSSVVDTTVRNTVLGMHAPLVKTFCGTEHVVEFEGTTEQGDSQAKDATEYLNYLLRKKNPGYHICSTWILDALYAKVGFLKVWWDDTPIESTEEYTGQTDVQLAMLMQDEEIELTEQRAYPDPEAEKAKAEQVAQMEQQLMAMREQAIVTSQQDMAAGAQAQAQFEQAVAQFEAFQAQPVPMLYDVTAKRTQQGGRMCIENVPPEEMLVSPRAKSLTDKYPCGHRVRRTIGQLKAAGYKNVEAIGTDDATDTSPEAIERNWINGVPSHLTSGDIDEDQREVWVTEWYTYADINGNGTPEWNKVVRAGNQILECTEVDDHPFVDLHSIPLPHRFFGLCPADLAIEHQRILTSLKRAALDNTYLQVNGRYFAVADQVNLDDLLNNRPGGVVRIKQQGAVGRLDQGMGDIGSALTLMERAQFDAEESTGYTRQTQGGNGLQLSNTATQANIITNRADSRVEIISRTMAETGFTLLFKKMLRLVTQFQKKADRVKLSGKWTDIDPREWTNQFNLTINVGLGTGSKDQQVQHLMVLKQAVVGALQIGYATPKNLYELDAKLVETLGFKNADQFLTDPDKMPPKPPQQDPAVVKAQLDDQAHQREIALKQQQAQMDAQQKQFEAQVRAQAQMETDRVRAEAEAQMHALKLQHEAEFNQYKEANRAAEMERQMAFEQWKLERQLDNQVVIAQINAKQHADATLNAAEDKANRDVVEGDDV